jgi:acetyl esterase/lipase
MNIQSVPIVSRRFIASRTLSWLLAVAVVGCWEGSVSPAYAAAGAAKARVKPAYQPPRGVRLVRDIQYIPGGDEAQRLDLYLPEKPADRPLPVVVHIHGGGWRAGLQSRLALTTIRRGNLGRRSRVDLRRS